MNYITRISLALAGMYMAGQLASAEILFQENFDNRETGANLATFGWTRDRSQADVEIIDQGNGDKAAQGTAAAWHTYAAPLAESVNFGFIWITCDFEGDSTGPRQYIALIQSLNSGNDIRIGEDSTLGNNHYWLRPGGDWDNSYDTGIAAAPAPKTLVAGIDLETGTAYFWNNPNETDYFDPTDGSGTADASATVAGKWSGASGNFAYILMNSYDVTYDNIIVATSADEVGLEEIKPPPPPPIPEGTNRNILWYEEPASDWTTALPIGNGRMGAMVYGQTESEIIQLNEDTLWSGGPTDYTNIGASNHLAHLRNLIFTEQYDEAATYGADNMLGDPRSQQGFQQLGNLELSFPGHDHTTSYRRQLDMENGLVDVQYTTVDGASFTREILASNPDQVIAMRFSSDQPTNITFSANLTSLHDGYTVEAIGSDGIILLGQADSIHFRSQLKVINEGGTVSITDGTLTVTNAESVVLLLVAATNFVKYDDVSADPTARCAAYMAAAEVHDFDSIKSQHTEDFGNLFDRVSIDLGGTSAELTNSTGQLLTDAIGGTRSALIEEQLFQFGRYMTISGARPGTQPLNLVGIWAVDGLNAPWGGKWTLNINAEMNVWPVESTNLPECHEPLLGLIEDLRVTGTSVAREHYDCDGFVAHHNTDLWRGAAPVDTAIHGLWTTGSAWLTRHIWEHYDFSRDRTFLATAYPTMKEAAAFYEDFLIEDPDGNLGTCPALSFEEGFKKNDGTVGRLTYSPTMDNQILRDLFNNCIMAAETLGIDEDQRAIWATLRDRLRPNEINPSTGRIMEWAFQAEKSGPNGQTPPMWGVSPGREINFIDTPTVATAAVKYLEFHIPWTPSYETEGSWVTGTLINSWARLGKSSEAYSVLNRAVQTCLYPNMMMYFYGQDYFQIDGNMGTTSGITEMLLQSQRLTANKEPILDLLPARPSQWPRGSVRGLKARGAFLVDLEWVDGLLAAVDITSLKGTPLHLQYNGKTSTIQTEARKVYRLNSDLEVFRITNLELQPNAQQLNLDISSRPGKAFHVACSDNLSTWSTCSDTVTPDATTTKLGVTNYPNDQASMFFKLTEE